MPTRLLVVDANVWIDLSNGGLVERVFQLGYSVSSPDVVVAELQSPSPDELLRLGLTVVELTGQQVLAVLKLTEQERRISAKDLAAFFVARDSGGVLLTGDAHLRRLAQQRGLRAKGTLWVLDEAIRAAILAERDEIGRASCRERV